MSIIVTEEDLCKKHDKVSAIFSSFSILPQNVVQPQCRGCSKMTLNPIYVLIIVTHSQGFVYIKNMGVKYTKQRPTP